MGGGGVCVLVSTVSTFGRDKHVGLECRTCAVRACWHFRPQKRRWMCLVNFQCEVSEPVTESEGSIRPCTCEGSKSLGNTYPGRWGVGG